MRICVYGASGAGKSTLATVLERATSFRFVYVCGDDYIRRESTDLENLRTRLANSPRFVFDHVSAPAVLQALGIVPDLVIYLQSQYRQVKCVDDGSMENNERQLSICNEGGWTVRTASNIQEAITVCLAYLHSSGLFPNTLRSFVIKVAAHCNLNCSYCYMYQGFDTEWRSAPAAMPEQVARQVGKRLAEHVDSCGEKVSCVIHGGEPLAVGARVFHRLVSAMKAEISNRPVAFSVQTNGTLITPDYLARIDELGLHIGISLDGASFETNRFRVDHSGAPAYDAIIRGIETCLSYDFQNGSFGGVLCVIDPTADGRQTYQELSALGLRGFDFLLRDEQHLSDPGGKTKAPSASVFLCSAFDAWLDDTSPCNVRLFQAVIGQIINANYSTDAIGLQPMDALAVGTTGDWEFLDILRICFPGAWKTSFSVFDKSVADVVASADYQRVLGWQYDLADACLACSHLAQCGGGYLPHRYHAATLFKSPSVHCAALFDLMSHVKQRLRVAGLPVM